MATLRNSSVPADLIRGSIRTFHIVVVPRKSKEQIKTVMHVQSCCFAYTISCF